MNSLTGLKVLVVEDEGSVALLIEDLLLDLGCNIAGSVASLPRAYELAQTVNCDLAILDVNLAGQSAVPVATILRQRQIPFVLSTGYGAAGVPAELKKDTVLGKPFTRAQFRQAIEAALS